MAIDITTIGIELDTTSLKAGTVALDNAARSGDKLAKSATNAGEASKKGFDDVAQSAIKSEKATEQASLGMGSFGRKAGMAGVQIQQLVGQIQGGQSAFVALSQQGADLGIVLGAPLVGAMIGIGAVVAGTLLPSLFDAGKAAKEVSDLTKELTKDFKDFNEEQKKVVSKGAESTITSLTEQLHDASNELGNAQADLKIASEKLLKTYGGKLKVRYGDGIEKEIAAVTLAQEKQLKIQQEINSLKDLSGSEKAIKALKDETDLINLKGEALWALKAKQAGYTEEKAKDYIAQGLLHDAAEKEKKDLEEKGRLSKSAVENSKKLSVASAEYMASIAARLAMSNKEVEQGDKLTEGQKLQAQLDLMLKEGKLSLTEANKKLLSQEFAQIDANDAANEARKKQIELDKQLLDKTISKNSSLDNEIEKQKEINAGYATGAQSASDLEKASYDLAISKLEIEKANDIALGKSKEIIDAIDDQIAKTKELQGLKGQEVGLKAIDSARKKSEEMTKSIGDSLSDALMRGFESGKGFAQNLKDTIQNMFKTLIIKPVIQPIMEKVASGVSSAVGALSSTGQYALVAAAAIGSLWNDYMEKDFKELTSEYRQGRQSTGTLLGNANAKSDSINKALSAMGDNGASLLDVNHGMYQALLDIKTGISGSAAGFAKTGLGSNATAGIKTGTSTNQGVTNFLNNFTLVGQVGRLLGGQVGGFVDSLISKISSLISSKKTSIIDSGVQILGGTLADAITSGTIGAMNYAEIQTTKKFLGLTTSIKARTQNSALDEEFKSQFADVFAGAGKALEEASKTFGVNFDASKLMIDATKLSLKGLSGDALTKEIEGFFSSTIDKWAVSLVDSLGQFQKVGEGAFETMVRLSTETNTFTKYAEKLLPLFNMTGLSAIEVTQSVAELSGGFDRLNTNMGSYYQNFFDDSEKTKAGLDAISKALADVGIVMPTTRDGFRSIVEGLDLTNDAQKKQFAALMDVNQAFAQFVPAAKAANETTKELTDSYNAIAEQQKTLSDKIFELTATDSEKRQRQLDSALSDYNRSLQQQIFDIEDAARINEGISQNRLQYEKRLSDEVNAVLEERARYDKAMQEHETNVLSEKKSLELELLRLQGNTAEIRKRELSTLDGSNQSLKEQIYALEDAKVAADLAAKAQEDAINAQNKALEDARQAAEEQRKLAQGVHDSISAALKSLMGQSDTLKTMTQAQARMTLQGALVTAKAGGSLVGYAGLQDALTAIQQEGSYSSATDSRLAIGRNIGLLSELAKYTDVNGSHANGLDYVPFDGYVAQLHKGERVQTASEAKSNGDLAAKVDRLIEVVNAGNIAIAQNTAKSAKIAEKWDNDGSPETRSVA